MPSSITSPLFFRENLPEFEVNKYIPSADVKQAYKVINFTKFKPRQ